jgi:hypothetical protein
MRSEDRKEQGNIPILVAMMLIFLIGTGLAYMRWSGDEGVADDVERAAAQARYLAALGVREGGLAYLESLTPNHLPTQRVDLPSGRIPGAGEYCNVYIIPEDRPASGDAACRVHSYRICATGIAIFENENGEAVQVARTDDLNAVALSFAAFTYLTDHERTIFGEFISYFAYDTLYGRIHSNDYMKMGGGVFYGLVTTSAPFFLPGSGNPVFVNHDPIFNYPPIQVPEEANTVRGCPNGMSFSGEGIYNHRLVFDGASGWRLYKWRIGTPYNDSLIAQGAPLYDRVMFFEGPLELMGQVYGTVTVGASGDIRLIDDIWYEDSEPSGAVNPESTNLLGIVSEENIIIGNTWANGRENSAQGSDIIINAAMMALGESFTFEDQNDIWEIYQGPYPDERGSIRLWGSVVQKRRGYVHRSNHAGTGYGRDYHEDVRLMRTPPPCFPLATNEWGHLLFDVIEPPEE